MKLNIGCGYKKKEGFVNIDLSPEVNPDQVVDVEQGLPFPDNSIDEIYSHHCLEHIKPDKWKFVLDEMARVSIDGAVWELILPTDNHWSRVNVDHYRTFGFTSFSQYTVKTDRPYYTNGWKLIDNTPHPNRFMRFLITWAILSPFGRWVWRDQMKFNFVLVKKERRNNENS